MTIKTFCAPFIEAVEEDRRDCHLRPDDIDRALEFFGPGLVKLYINPMYLSGKTKLDYQFPENVEVVGHHGVAGWELQGEVKEDKNSTTEKQVPENAVTETSKNTVSKQQDAKTNDDMTLGGRMTPPDKNKGVDFDYSASKTISSYENDSILTKRGFNPSFRKKYPAQKERML